MAPKKRSKKTKPKIIKQGESGGIDLNGKWREWARSPVAFIHLISHRYAR